MQVKGTTHAWPRFTFHNVNAGMGGVAIGWEQVGGACVGAVEGTQAAAETPLGTSRFPSGSKPKYPRRMQPSSVEMGGADASPMRLVARLRARAVEV